MNRSSKIHNQYEQWPYPHIPIIGSVRRADTWQINLAYLKDRSGLPPPPRRPRILIAGCGTFQPYVFALANPHTKILAADISQKSLRIARYRNLLHGITGVKYQIVDLNNPDTYPDGPFDYIECYGVLMNLDRPERTLKELAARLSDNGIIRIMVYPHYSRQRIFQIQRLAKLLGLNCEERSHPSLLRKIILSLPPSHPLYYAFTTYRDSQNDAGIVDGFLHAGDRGFTGSQLGELLLSAGCKPAFYFHRPWGEPEAMAKKLGLSNQSQSFILHYLDLWQELRTNFIVCLVKEERLHAPAETAGNLHPLLSLKSGPFVHRLKLLPHYLFGITLPSRTDENPVSLTGQEMRSLLSGKGDREKLRRLGLLLGGTHKPIAMPAYTPWAAESDATRAGIEIGPLAANPFYDRLFQAYTFQRDCQPAGLMELSEQIKRWGPIADPLEDTCEFGLTPFGTYACFSNEILDYVAKGPAKETVEGFDRVRFLGEERGMEEVLSFLKRHPHLPQNPLNEAALRELWILLFSYRRLFLDASRI